MGYIVTVGALQPKRQADKSTDGRNTGAKQIGD